MNESIDNYLDVMIIIIVLICSLTGMSLLTGYWSTSIVADRQDKTSLDTIGTIEVDSVKKTGNDVLLSLIIVDEGIPYPRAAKYGSMGLEKIDNRWVIEKYAKIGRMYSGGLSEYLSKKITSVELKWESTGNCYWQYTFEP